MNECMKLERNMELGLKGRRVIGKIMRGSVEVKIQFLPWRREEHFYVSQGEARRREMCDVEKSGVIKNANPLSPF